MTDRELMQQALEALDWAADCIEPRKPHNCDCPVCVASDALREWLAQPETVMAEYKFQTYAAYKTPPDGEMKIGVVPTTRREWVGLTATEVHETEGYEEDRKLYLFARAIEAKLKEKNA